MPMSYVGAAEPAPASGTAAGYSFYKGMFDYIFSTYNTFETTTNTNISTLNTAVGTPTAISTPLALFKRDVNAAGNLGSAAIGGTATITNAVAQLLITAAAAMTPDTLRIRQADGTDALRVDQYGNTVVGASTQNRGFTVNGTITGKQPDGTNGVAIDQYGNTVIGATGQTRGLTVNGTFYATSTITAGDHFIGALTGDVSGNSTGVKNVAVGTLLVGAGASAPMSLLAPGAAAYVLTSNGPGTSPTWQASAGGGGGGGTVTDTQVTNSATDATNADLFLRWISGPVEGSVILGTTGGLGMYVPDPTNPLVVQVGGRKRKSTVSVYSTIGNLSPGVSVAGIYALAADVSTAGTNLFALAILAPGQTPTAYQLIIGHAAWDGNTFQLGANGGFLYDIQSPVNSYNLRTVRNKISRHNPNGGVALTLAGSATALPGATSGAAQIVITQNPPLSGLTAEIDFGATVNMPAAQTTIYLYVYYSQGLGVAPTTQVLPSIDGFGTVVSTRLSLSQKALIEGLDSRPLNLGFFYATGASTVILTDAWMTCKFTR